MQRHGSFYKKENEANKIKKTDREKTTTKTTEIRQYQAEG